MEPLLKDTLNEAPSSNYLPTKDTLCGSKNRLSKVPMHFKSGHLSTVDTMATPSVSLSRGSSVLGTWAWYEIVRFLFSPKG